MDDNTEVGPQTGRSAKRMNVDLDSMSVAELIALRDAAESKRQEKLEDAKDAILARARSELEALGLSLENVFATPVVANPSKRGHKQQREMLPVKFSGPNGETWSGRGRLPKWLHAIEANGGNRSQYLVKLV